MVRAAREQALGWSILLAAVVGVLAAYAATPGQQIALATAVIATAAGGAVLAQLGPSKLVLALMLASAFLTPMNGLRLTSFMNVSDAFLLAACVVVVPTRLLRSSRGEFSSYRKVLSSLGLVVLGGFLASALSPTFGHGGADLVRFAFSTIAVLVLVALWEPDGAEIRGVVWAYVLGAAVSAAVGVAGGDTPYLGRAIGLSNHPNHFGIISMLAGGAAIGIGLTSRGVARVVALTLSAVLALGVVISGSRAALVGSAMSFLVFCVSMQNWRVLRVAVVVGLFMLLGGVFGVLHLPHDNAVERLFREDPRTQASNEERKVALTDALAQIRERPLVGSGFEFARSAHSVYLQMWTAAGVFGLLGILRLTATVVKTLFWRASREPLHTAMIATFFGYLTAGIFTASVWDRYIWLFLGLALALSTSLARRREGALDTALVARTHDLRSASV